MNIKKWLKENKKDLENKTICITGSTGGLAKTFIDIVSNININFIFINRDMKKTAIQKDRILQKNSHVNIEIICADQFDINSIKLAVEKLKSLKFDYLILNAAVYNVPIRMSPQGFNNIFQIINFIFIFIDSITFFNSG